MSSVTACSGRVKAFVPLTGRCGKCVPEPSGVLERGVYFFSASFPTYKGALPVGVAVLARPSFPLPLLARGHGLVTRAELRVPPSPTPTRWEGTQWLTLSKVGCFAPAKARAVSECGDWQSLPPGAQASV